MSTITQQKWLFYNLLQEDFTFRWALGLIQQFQAVVHIKWENYIKDNDDTTEKISTAKGRAHWETHFFKSQDKEHIYVQMISNGNKL